MYIACYWRDMINIWTTSVRV